MDMTDNNIGQAEEVSQPEGEIQQGEETSNAVESQETTDDPVSRETETEPEVISMTKDDLVARDVGIRKVAEKRVRRQVEAELAQKSASQPPGNAGGDSFWDPTLNTYVPYTTPVSDYMALYNQSVNGQAVQQAVNQQPVYQQPPVAQKPVTPDSKPDLTDDALLQFSTLTAKDPAAQQAILSAPITIEMANAIAVDPHGVENLYSLVKESPHILYQISQLDPLKQQQKMWEINQKANIKRAPKVETKATPQPAPLPESGNVNKPYAEMSYQEKQALADQKLREAWHR